MSFDPLYGGGGADKLVSSDKAISSPQQDASVCTTMVSLYFFRIHCAFSAAPQMNRSLLDVITRFCIEIDTGFDRVRDIGLVSSHFQSFSI